MNSSSSLFISSTDSSNPNRSSTLTMISTSSSCQDSNLQINNNNDNTSSGCYNNSNIYFNQNSYSDANPRKYSLMPASPPTNIELEINETCSLETVNLMTQAGCSSITNNLNTNENNSISNTIQQQEQIQKQIKSQFVDQQSNSHTNSIHNQHHHHKKQASKNNDLNNNIKFLNREVIASKTIKNSQIETCLEKWYTQLKSHVLSEFEKSRIDLLEELHKRLTDEKEKQKIEIEKLKNELDQKNQVLKTKDEQLAKKTADIEHMNKILEKQAEKNDLCRVMSEWKLKKLENEKENFSFNIATKYFEQRTKLRVFLKWHICMVNRNKTKLEAKLKKKAEEVCFSLATKYEAKIKKIEEELKLSKLEIDKYKLEMSKNEENMKKALMRGVCALNLEAMSILNESNFNNNTSLVGNNQIQVNKKNPQQQIQLNESQENNTNRNAKLVADLKEKLDTRNNLNSCRDQSSLKTTRSVTNENEIVYDSVLNRKVKEYCELNLKLDNSDEQERNEASISALKVKSKSSDDIELLKQNILNKKYSNQRNSVPNDQQQMTTNRMCNSNNTENQRFVEELIVKDYDRNLARKERVFEELFHHPDPQTRQKNANNCKSKLEVKSKIGSLPIINNRQTTCGVFHHTAPNIPLSTLQNISKKPVLIEKHNESTDLYNCANKRSTNDFQSYSGSHPFTILNTRSLSK